MRATLTILILVTVAIGFGMVGSAFATDAGATSDASPGLLADAGAPDKEAGPSAPETAEEAAGVATDIVQDIRAGSWRKAAVGALLLVMFGLAKVRNKFKWFAGDRGGAVLVGVLAMAGALVTGLASDAAMDWRLFSGAAFVMWGAVGGYTWIKRLIWPKDAEG